MTDGGQTAEEKRSHDSVEGERRDRGAGEQSADADAEEQKTDEEEVQEAFRGSVQEGRERLGRSWGGLLSTGLVGGMDVSLGVLALLVVEEATGSTLLAGLGFAIGFIALTLGKSELFTENFLVPVAAVAADRGTLKQLVRLWGGTAVTNLAGGWFLAWLMMAGLPRLRETAVTTAEQYTSLGFWELAVLGVLAGMAITLMTWMERGATSEIGRIVAVTAIAFLLVTAPLNHVIVVSIKLFAAILGGAASFGYVEWARIAGIATVSNMLGGLVLVTLLRLIQVGTEGIRRERDR